LMSGQGAPKMPAMKELLELPPPFEQTPAARPIGVPAVADEIGAPTDLDENE